MYVTIFKFHKELLALISGDLVGRLLEQEVQGGDALPIRHLPPVLLPHRY